MCCTGSLICWPATGRESACLEPLPLALPLWVHVAACTRACVRAALSSTCFDCAAAHLPAHTFACLLFGPVLCTPVCVNPGYRPLSWQAPATQQQLVVACGGWRRPPLQHTAVPATASATAPAAMIAATVHGCCCVSWQPTCQPPTIARVLLRRAARLARAAGWQMPQPSMATAAAAALAGSGSPLQHTIARQPQQQKQQRWHHLLRVTHP